MSLSRGLSVSVCLAAFAVLAGRLPADSIRLRDGREVRGEITKESFKGITVANKLVPRADIDETGIKYDPPEPPQLIQARDALRGRDFAAAHRAFKSVAAQAESAGGGSEKAGKKKGAAKAAAKTVGGIRAIFLQHAIWGDAQTYRDEGNKAGAAAAADDLLRAFPDTWYIREALMLKIESAEGSAEGIAEAKRLAEGAGAGTELSESLDLLQARALARAGNKAEAEKVFTALAKSASGDVADEAKVYTAILQISRGEMTQAVIALRQVYSSSKSRSVLCGAARGLGDAKMKEIEKKPDADGLREALEWYLRAAVLHFPGPGESSENHQAALLSAAKCAEDLMKISTATDKKNTRVQEGYRTVARDLYREIVQTYPRTDSAKLANDALRRLPGTGT